MNFSYQSPLSQRQIRLLVLEHGSKEDTLSISLRTVSLDEDELGYNALSYSWDDQTPILPIQCNGAHFKITRNVYEALVTLRDTSQSIVLWIDQICINQADIEERNHQVHMMSEIYARAYKVVIWLGLEDDSTSTAFRLLDLFARIGKHKLNRSQTMHLLAGRQQDLGFKGLASSSIEHSSTQRRHSSGTDGDDLENDLASVSLLNAGELEHLASLLSGSWFRRIWTFGEAVLGSRLTEFHCGRFVRGIDAVTGAIAVLESCGYRGCTQYDHPAFQAFGTLLFISTLRMYWRHYESRPSLYFLLLATGKLTCKDAHDKVYALLGICKPAYLALLKVDYTQSLEELCGAVVKAGLAIDQDFGLLSFVQHRDDKVIEQPSWVPDLHESRWMYSFSFILSFDPNDHIYKACGQHKHPKLLSSNALQLKLLGAKYRQITTVGTEIHISTSYTDFDSWHDSYLRKAEMLNITNHRSNGNKFARILNSDLLTYRDGASKLLPTYANIMAARFRRAVGADYYPRAEESRSRESLRRHRFPLLCRWRDEGLQGNVRLEVLHEHTKHVKEVTRNRKLCIVGQECDEDERLCIIPFNAKVGDWICVLFGGDAPFVLREVKKEEAVITEDDDDAESQGETHWLFLADCYVEGIMDGEVMERKEEDECEIFTLV